jgi:hypothetical protein
MEENKMEFIKRLIERNSPYTYNNEDTGFRIYKALQMDDDVLLSIQASYGHYCTPRQTLDIELYSAMELAILKNGKFVSVDQVTDNTSLIEKFDEYYEGMVYGFVPVELLEELYQELKQEVTNNESK